MAARKNLVKGKPAAPIYPPEINVELQYGQKAVNWNQLYDRLKEVWQITGRSLDEIKKLDLYVKPEEDKAYYVVNGTEKGSFYLF